MPRSSRACAKAPPEPSTSSGSLSGAASRRWRRPNALVTSDTQVIVPDPNQVESALAECGFKLKEEFGIPDLIASWGREALDEPGFELALVSLAMTEER